MNNNTNSNTLGTIWVTLLFVLALILLLETGEYAYKSYLASEDARIKKELYDNREELEKYDEIIYEFSNKIDKFQKIVDTLHRRQ